MVAIDARSLASTRREIARFVRSYWSGVPYEHSGARRNRPKVIQESIVLLVLLSK
jgi:hypothetical protein